MNCPGCKERCELKNKFYYCRLCGAQEKLNNTGKGMIWVRDGVVIAAPEAVEDQLKKAEEREPNGDWVKARKNLYKEK